MQVGLQDTLCYRFHTKQALTGSVEVILHPQNNRDCFQTVVQVSYVSLRSVYPVMESYWFWLAASRVSCLCDCPGGASHCSPHSTRLCGNMTNCAEYYNPSVESAGCVLGWLSLSAALCCSVQAQQTCQASPEQRKARLSVY